MNAPAYWTAADEAELQAILWALAGAAIAHRDDCARCRALNAWCEPMRAAGEAMLDWLTGRRLLSRAQALRARAA